MRRQPANLKELNDICTASGFDLVGELGTTVRTWQLTKPQPNILQARLVLILVLPKSRHAGTPQESEEIRAFLTGKTVSEVGVAIGVAQKDGDHLGYVIGCPQPKIEDLTAITVATLQVVHTLSAENAARSNGVIERFGGRVFAVGMGALGSQIFNNLVRAGFGKWSLTDPDVFLPHNGARHQLGMWAVGHNKASAMADLGNAVLDDTPVTTALSADVLNPGKQAQDLAQAYDSSEIVFDFSASISVSRYLASTQSRARHLSAFLNPHGDCLIIAVEDKERRFRLDWLEMLHYRAVLNEPQLSLTLQAREGILRYGNGCRDVSFQVAQDDVAIAAALASKAIKRIQDNPHASISIYQSDHTGAVRLFRLNLTTVFTCPLQDWSVRFDQELYEKVIRFRQARLPNETGGILLGNFDTHRRVCSIVDLIPSPPDSIEWPTSYIRGSNGLAQKVQEIEAQTSGQIGYVGEWHSHPDGASINASPDDLKAYSWLQGHMNLETLPAIMMIAGDCQRFNLISAEA